MSNVKRVVFSLILLLVPATASMASSFRAADLVYLPAVARVEGGFGSFFRTDVTISNVSNQSVIVSVAYAPTGAGNNNSGITANMVELPVFAPGERRTITDIGQTINQPAANGFLLFFACRQGATCADCDVNPANCELITVQGRIYNTREDNATFGQLFPGIPWYNYVSIDAQQFGLHRAFIPGIQQDASFRSNIGLLNSSQFSNTTLRVTLFNQLGVQFGTPFSVNMGPLAHFQASVANMFPGFTGRGYVLIEQVSFTALPDVENALPGFMAYGSLLDNISNDPTTLEAHFDVELPFECVYGSKPQRRPVRR